MRDLPDLPEVGLSGAEDGDGLDLDELIALGFPEVGEVGSTEFLKHAFKLRFAAGVEDHEFLSLLVVGDSRDGKRLDVDFGELMELLLDLDVGHHLATDLAEPAEPVRDGDEPVFIDGGDVPRFVPAVLENAGGLFGLPQIALHDVEADGQSCPASSRPAGSRGRESPAH